MPNKTDYSYEPLLAKWLKKLNPANILEWGPGASTGVIHRECPNSKILSIESNAVHHKKMAEYHSYAEIIYAPIPDYGPTQYPCWPLLNRKGVKYDLIFVDGRQRVSCLVTSLSILSKSGVVILHDSERPHYKHGIELFDVVDLDEYTAVLKPKMNSELKETFAQIHSENLWGSKESRSDPGSEVKNVERMVPKLQKAIDDLGIKSLLDIPCGDYNWIKRIKVKQYVGADIVPDLLEKNQWLNPNVDFRLLDVTSDDLPRFDAVLCRDLLGHFSVENAQKAIENIKRSGARYLISTTFPSWKAFLDAKDGGWYPINLEIPPFGLSAKLLVNEECTEGNGAYSDKSLGVFELSAPAFATSGKKLTIGMAAYDDFDGVFFTCQSIRLHHKKVADKIQIIVIDGNPTSEHGKATKGFCQNTHGAVKYIEAPSTYGPAQTKELVFRNAETPHVLCIDCHILLESGCLAKLIDFMENDDGNLLQGPLLYDDLDGAYTHMDQVWRGGMLGIWGADDRGLKPDSEPFEIPAQGMGLFACRKDAWPSFNPKFKGFGGEECYIHEKFRQKGKKTLCLPFLRWSHRFGRPFGIPYKCHWEDRIFNYFVGHMELGMDTKPVFDHFSEILNYEKVKACYDSAVLAMKE